MVEWARLESVCAGNRTEGSNPSLSAILSVRHMKTSIKFSQLLAWTPLCLILISLLYFFLNEDALLLDENILKYTGLPLFIGGVSSFFCIALNIARIETSRCTGIEWWNV